MRANSSGRKSRRHRKIVKSAKGFRGLRGRIFKQAKTALMRAGRHAYIGRKRKKRDFRRLWIVRIKAFLNNQDLSYSSFMNNLKKSNIIINRKMLAELAVNQPDIFSEIIKAAKPEAFSKMLKVAKVQKENPDEELAKEEKKLDKADEKIKEDEKEEKDADKEDKEVKEENKS